MVTALLHCQPHLFLLQFLEPQLGHLAQKEMEPLLLLG
jgi:hypothetical protein